MADLILRYSGNGPAPYGDPFVVKDAWPPWQKQMWIDALSGVGYGPERKPFVPTYEAHTVSWMGNDGRLVTVPIEQHEIPTRETADVIAQRYAIKGVPLHILEHPWVGEGGGVTSKAISREVQFPNLATLPVKQLAEYFTNAPEDQFPNVADKECRDLIARVWPG